MDALSENEATAMAKKLPSWQMTEGKIVKRFEFKDFVASMSFVNKVADIAEKENHHPDILISYNKVSLTLSTHSAGGLTEKDFVVAAKIDNLDR